MTDLIYGSLTASSADWPNHANPTGWGKPADRLNLEHSDGLVGHCWKALTIITQYSELYTVVGVRTDSQNPFSVEHSLDGQNWVTADGGASVTGTDHAVVTPLAPFACRFTRMSWATTGGTNGIHAQFVGAAGDRTCEDSNTAFDDACKSLKDRIEDHLAALDEAFAKDVAEREAADDGLDSRLEAVVAEFERHYDAQVEDLKAEIARKQADHEARIAEIQTALHSSRQRAIDQAAQKMQAKIDTLASAVEAAESA